MQKNTIATLLACFIYCGIVAQSEQIPGAINPAFGGNGTGFNTLDIGVNDVAYATLITGQGYIILGGTSDLNFAVARFLADGTIDPSFGSDGPGFTILSLGGSDNARAMVRDSQGRIILGGFTDVNGSNDFAIARFNANGSVDTSFGPANSGFSIFPSFGLGSDDRAFAMVIDSQDRILLAGSSNVDGTTDFAVARFNADGSVDTSFGPANTGFNTFAFPGGSFDQANALALDAQGRILLAGSSDSNGTDDFALVRFTSNGSIDNNFGSSGPGYILISFALGVDVAHAMVLDSQGRILLGGQSGAGGLIVDFALARVLGDGSLDTSFGPDKTGTTTLDLSGLDVANAIALDSQRRILLGGLGGVNTDFAIARFSENGSIDSSFGTTNTGFTLLNLGSTSDIVHAIALTSQGSIILAGTTIVGTQVFALAEFFGEEFVNCTLAIREKYCFLP